ncbi:MAG: sigma factor-like helix-turn-helix DNA-binding protein, partial [Gemmatimonadota bacterium]
ALIDTSLPPPDAAVAREQLHDQIEALVDHLEGREQLIVRRYYGLDGQEPSTLDQIGTTLGITRERVRQLKERALAQLRDPRVSGGMEYLLEPDESS